MFFDTWIIALLASGLCCSDFQDRHPDAPVVGATVIQEVAPVSRYAHFFSDPRRTNRWCAEIDTSFRTISATDVVEAFSSVLQHSAELSVVDI